MTTALLAEDEPLLAQALQADLARLWPGVRIVASVGDGLQAAEQALRLRPDLCFFDIRMPGQTGLEAAQALVEDWPEGTPFPLLVFITAYDQYAVEAFEHGAIDYVLKPAEAQRLSVTVARVRQRLAQRQQSGSEGTADALQTQMQRLLASVAGQMVPGGQAPARLKWIQATVGQQIQMIPVEDILFFISDEKYTRVQTLQQEALIRKPIKELLEELDPDLFWQIHRSTLVNTRAIAGVHRDLRGRQIVTVKGHPEKLEVSRSYTQLFKGM
jgi:DNA-binding LytR/AlgR family response regulator